MSAAKKINESLDLISVNSQSAINLPTANVINSFLKSNDLTINGHILNANSLQIINSSNDLDWIPKSQEGCYFIFSTLTPSQIPCFSEDGYRCCNYGIEKNGETFYCLYNGKGNNTRERIIKHLFSEKTILKALQNDTVKISNTGAMSLDTMTEEQANQLESRGQFNRKSKQLNLKPVKKTIKPISNVKHDDKIYFLNGINIREPQWSTFKWAVCVILTDSEFGKQLIEEAFASQNGRPPLCKRHG